MIVGRLKVIEPTPLRTKSQSRIWRCECECGNSVNVSAPTLKAGRESSCGCLALPGPQHRNWTGHGSISGAYWSALRFTAKARNYPFEITPEYAWEVFVSQGGLCALSGVELTFGELRLSKEKREQTASLDRTDPALGYFPGNVQWVHKRVNKMKTDLPNAEFLDWCIRIARNQASS